MSASALLGQVVDLSCQDCRGKVAIANAIDVRVVVVHHAVSEIADIPRQ
jgi:hypothetical protein